MLKIFRFKGAEHVLTEFLVARPPTPSKNFTAQKISRQDGKKGTVRSQLNQRRSVFLEIDTQCLLGQILHCRFLELREWKGCLN